MRSRRAILLLVLYMVALIRPIAPFFEYAVNINYIANVLCINKDEPKMQCNGKCYLNKQLKKANDEEKGENLPVRINWKDYPVGFIDVFSLKFSSLHVITSVDSFALIFLTSGFSSQIFHPPKF